MSTHDTSALERSHWIVSSPNGPLSGDWEADRPGCGPPRAAAPCGGALVLALGLLVMGTAVAATIDWLTG